MQLDAVASFAQRLDRGLVFDQGDDDLSRLGIGLLAHDDEVAGQDARVEHALALDAQAEQLARCASRLERDVAVEVLDGGLERAGGNTAEHRHHHGRRRAAAGQAIAPRLARLLGQPALLDQRLEVRILGKVIEVRRNLDV